MNVRVAIALTAAVLLGTWWTTRPHPAPVATPTCQTAATSVNAYLLASYQGSAILSGCAWIKPTGRPGTYTARVKLGIEYDQSHWYDVVLSYSPFVVNDLSTAGPPK